MYTYLEAGAAAIGMAQLGAIFDIVGVATGGWRVSAERKLSTVGVPTDLLYATADDAEARVDIFGLAWTRATAHSARPGVTVLVGDSVWDVATARRLGWRFLGVGRGANARHLREAGAALIVPDYADLDACDTLERCQVPGEKTHGESFQEVHHARTLRPRGRAAP